MELLTAALTWEHVSIHAELRFLFSKVTAQQRNLKFAHISISLFLVSPFTYYCLTKQSLNLFAAYAHGFHTHTILNPDYCQVAWPHGVAAVLCTALPRSLVRVECSTSCLAASPPASL